VNLRRKTIRLDFIIIIVIIIIGAGSCSSSNSEHQVAVATRFYSVAPEYFGIPNAELASCHSSGA